MKQFQMPSIKQQARVTIDVIAILSPVSVQKKLKMLGWETEFVRSMSTQIVQNNLPSPKQFKKVMELRHKYDLVEFEGL